MAEDSAQLLAALDGAVRRELLPFFQQQGVTYSSGSLERGSSGVNILVDKKWSDVCGTFFWWIHRFSSEHAVFEIGFGDREYVVETSISYPAIKKRFGAWELLMAAKIPDWQAMNGIACLSSSGLMERTIGSIAHGTKKYWSLLSHPDSHLVDCAQELRRQRLISQRAEQRGRDMERASIQASRAFHEKRLDETIRLLNPFRDDHDLSPSSRMLLQLAEKRLQ